MLELMENAVNGTEESALAIEYLYQGTVQTGTGEAREWLEGQRKRVEADAESNRQCR